mmetsp:Transcript_18374/g.47910  ORF Transcript_18374/g.47910 Transcript_18374/m.47910 type:complete len:207 (-) Transcript_18374:889-1509(-)
MAAPVPVVASYLIGTPRPGSSTFVRDTSVPAPAAFPKHLRWSTPGGPFHLRGWSVTAAWVRETSAGCGGAVPAAQLTSARPNGVFFQRMMIASRSASRAAATPRSRSASTRSASRAGNGRRAAIRVRVTATAAWWHPSSARKRASARGWTDRAFVLWLPHRGGRCSLSARSSSASASTSMRSRCTAASAWSRVSSCEPAPKTPDPP